MAENSLFADLQVKLNTKDEDEKKPVEEVALPPEDEGGDVIPEVPQDLFADIQVQPATVGPTTPEVSPELFRDIPVMPIQPVYDMGLDPYRIQNPATPEQGVYDATMSYMNKVDRRLNGIGEGLFEIGKTVVMALPAGLATMGSIGMSIVEGDSGEVMADDAEKTFAGVAGWLAADEGDMTQEALETVEAVSGAITWAIEGSGNFLAGLASEGATSVTNMPMGELKAYDVEAEAFKATAARLIPDLMLTLVPIKGLQMGKSRANTKAATTETRAARQAGIDEQITIDRAKAGEGPQTFDLDQFDATPAEPTPPFREGESNIDAPLSRIQEVDGRIPLERPLNIRDVQEIAVVIRQVKKGEMPSGITISRRGDGTQELTGGRAAVYALELLQSQGVNIGRVPVRVVRERAPLTNAQRVSRDKLAREAESRYVEALSYRENRAIAIRKGYLTQAKEAFIDRSARVYESLKAVANPEGQTALEFFQLVGGATGAAQRRYDATRAAIFGRGHRERGPLPGVDGKPLRMDIPTKNGTQNVAMTFESLFNEVVRLQREIAIADSRGGAARAKAARTANARLSYFDDFYGKKLMDDVFVRTRMYFNERKLDLRMLRDEGIISADEYKRMANIDYARTQMIDEIIDPVNKKVQGPERVSVTESGIEPLGDATRNAINYDAELLHIQSMIRVHRRVARNRAARALGAVVKQEDNGIGRVAPNQRAPNGTYTNEFKPGKHGEVLIQYFDNGKKRGAYVNEAFGDAWLAADPQASQLAIAATRFFTGSQAVKFFATGANLGFLPVTLAMDTIHAFFALSNVYKTSLPRFVGQLSMDLINTFDDALAKRGKYEDLVSENGFMDFRATQGVLPLAALDRAAQFQGRIGPRTAELRGAIAAPGEFMEIWVRLAVRDRVLRNQAEAGLPLNPTQATAVARAMIDFNRGGTVVRFFDSAVPYLNASAQAMRTTLAPATRGKVKTGVDRVERPARWRDSDQAEWLNKVSQVTAAYAGLELWNWYNNREAHADVPDSIKRTHMIFHTGGTFIDEMGRRRYAYVVAKKDPTIVPISGIAEMAVQRMMTGRPPTDDWFDHMKAAVPAAYGAIPTLQAYMSYVNNKDLWFNEDVWRGRSGISPEVEETDRTHPLAQGLGDITGLSPVRLQQAFDTMIPANSYLKALDLTGEAMAGTVGMTPEQYQTFIDRSGREMVAAAPVARRVYKLTSPESNLFQRSDIVAEDARTQAARIDRDVGRITRGLDTREMTTDEAIGEALSLSRAYESQGDFFLAQKLVERTEAAIKIDAAFDTSPELIESTSRAWWRNLYREQDSAARASMYYELWVTSPPEIREKMDVLSGALSESNLSLRDQKFNFWFEELKVRQGDDPPGFLTD